MYNMIMRLIEELSKSANQAPRTEKVRDAQDMLYILGWLMRMGKPAQFGPPSTERPPDEKVANETIPLRNLQGNAWQNLQRPDLRGENDERTWFGNDEQRPTQIAFERGDTNYPRLDTYITPRHGLMIGPRIDTGRAMVDEAQYLFSPLLWRAPGRENRQDNASMTTRLLDLLRERQNGLSMLHSMGFGGPGFGSEPTGYATGTAQYDDWMDRRRNQR